GSVSFPFLVARCYESTYTSFYVSTFRNYGESGGVSALALYSDPGESGILEQRPDHRWWDYNVLRCSTYFIPYGPEGSAGIFYHLGTWDPGLPDRSGHAVRPYGCCCIHYCPRVI